VIAGVGDRQLLVARLPLDKSIDALADRARDVAVDLGYTARPADTWCGLSSRTDYMAYLEKTMPEATRWSSLATADGPTIQFWYRSSPRLMVPTSDSGMPSLQDPPVIITGMISIFLDPRGRLNEFLAVPPQTDTSADPPPPTDWSRAFADAGLAMNQFKPATPQWLPRLYADQRAAWTGPLPDPPQTTVRVEMAAYRGQVTYFSIVGPWTQPTRMVEETRTAQSRVLSAVTSSMGLSLLVMIAVLARHNLKVGRGDRRGAARFAAFVLGIWFFVWLIGGRHVLDVNVDTNDFFSHVSSAFFNTGLLWLVYIALEPYVRRHSPEILMSWTRLLAGERRDPRVGRDVLIGVAVGISVALIGIAYRFAMPLLHGPTPWPKGVNLSLLWRTRTAVAAVLRMVPNAMQNAMILTFLFAFVRAIVKHTGIAAAVAIAVFGVFVLNEFGDSLLFGIPFVVLWTGLFVATLVLFGMLPLTVAFFVNQTLSNGPFTLDMSKQYASTSLWTLALVAGLAVFGFYASRGNEPLLGDILTTE
jgi:serine/threonine-protein kinase